MRAAAAPPPVRAAPGEPTLAMLIWHTSDLSIKPIVANRRIERLPEPKWDPAALAFQALVRPRNPRRPPPGPSGESELKAKP